MVKSSKLFGRIGQLGSAVALIGATLLPTLMPAAASAAALTSRSVDLSSSLGGATAVKHSFTFTAPAGSTLQSMEFQYCDNPVPTVACVQAAGAAGVSVTSAVISGAPTGLTGWSLGTNTASKIQITRTNATALGASVTATIVFSGITNPAFPGNSPTGGNSFYVRMRAYTDTAYTTLRDKGAVASATTNNIDLTAIVRETLSFCVGTALGAATDCSTVTGTAVGLGDVDDVLSLSTATINRDHSFFRLSTNASGGSVVKYSAKSGAASGTLADGTNTIAPVSSEVAFTTPGTTEQFGLAIDTSVVGGSTLCSQTVQPGQGLLADAAYNEGAETVAGAKYNFNAASGTTPVTIATGTTIVDWATCAVGYAANISPTTPAGVYTSSVNYIAVPTY